ncbi:hypothetical protein J5N97_027774 [Dioscorea zingiberensis]|uniref:Uncharacterized protein n=1 Tax=Dioscorea zingiberensis TaxID=325984 RepID=A0A9D5BXR8_9LILI|nr:hypothetical protein J5N97_027774 [Dioscorea zingiberensis]
MSVSLLLNAKSPTTDHPKSNLFKHLQNPNSRFVMAVVSICPRISRVYHASNSVVSIERRSSHDNPFFQKFLISSRRLNVLHVKFDKFYLYAKKEEGVDGVEGLRGGKLESGSNEEQLRVLDSYFSRLQGDMDEKLGSLVSESNHGSVSEREVQDMKEMVVSSGKNKKVTGLAFWRTTLES